MTLAKILVIGVCGIAWAFSAITANAQQSTQSTSSTDTGNAGTQEGIPNAQPSPEKKQLPADAKSTKKPAQSSKRVHRKKRAIADCPDTPDPSPAASVTPSASTSAPDSHQGQNAGTTKKAPCPPPKIVVHQGGTTDTSIQLAGGPGSQSSQANATAGPLLDATEANLKKLEERQLSDTEQDMVTQIRQFMQQSKAAVAAGDVERARTLAWKAQTLSEDLVKPEK